MNQALFTRSEDIEKVALPGGATLLSQIIPSSLSVSVGVWIRSGSRHEQPEQSGISHFTEHMLFKGTKTRSAYDIALTLDRLGGHLDAFTAKEYTCYTARLLAEYFDRALDVISDLVSNPQLDSDLFELEKKVVTEEIRNVQDDPDDLIYDLVAGEVFQDHPLGRPILGTEESVAALTPAMLRDYLSQRYTGDRIVIAVAGPLDHSLVADKVRGAFQFRRGSGDEDAMMVAPVPARRLRHESRDLQQQHLWLGRRGLDYRHPDRFALLLMATMLGGSMSSRLFQSIREKAALAYSVYSYADFAVDSGVMGTYMAVSPDRCDEAIALTLDEFVRLADSGCSKSELEDTKMQVKGNILLAMESIGARMARLARNEINFGRQVKISEIVEAIDGVTREDIERAAGEYLDPSRLALVSLGPSPASGPF